MSTQRSIIIIATPTCGLLSAPRIQLHLSTSSSVCVILSLIKPVRVVANLFTYCGLHLDVIQYQENHLREQIGVKRVLHFSAKEFLFGSVLREIRTILIAQFGRQSEAQVTHGKRG